MISAVAALVQEVGQALLSWRSEGGTDGAWSGTQFHAKADGWAHERLHAGLSRLAADIPIVSEEAETSAPAATEPYWLIDPIDGTASYAGGFPGFVTQVALMRDGQPVLAAVYAPASGELFLAERGSGAFRNGIRLTPPLSSSLLLIDNAPAPTGTAAELYRALQCTGYLESGSIGLKICRVADGTADLFVKSVRTRDWDLAAPQLILNEAGGSLVNGRGDRIEYSGHGVHDGLIAARDAEISRRVVASHLARPTDAVVSA